MPKKKVMEQFAVSTVPHMIAYVLYHGDKYAVTHTVRRLRESKSGRLTE